MSAPTMSCFGASLSFVWLLAGCFLPRGTVADAAEASMGGSPVEPFVGDWCAAQFPEQLSTDSSATDEGRHVPIEPFVGLWCMEQFPEELASGVLNETEAIVALYDSHERIEPYISKWGTAEQSNGGHAELELYVGDWCVSQWQSQVGTFDPLDRLNRQEDEVPIEPAFGEWCFEVYPEQLASLDRSAAVAALYQQHESIENNLVPWAVANDDGGDRSRSVNALGVAGFASALIIAAALVAAVVIFVARRSRQASHSTLVASHLPPMDDEVSDAEII